MEKERGKKTENGNKTWNEVFKNQIITPNLSRKVYMPST
jgi:hypothetical protein